MQQHFIDEIFAQPTALADLLTYYAAHEPRPLKAQSEHDGVLLTGMGASFHAATIAAYQFQRQGVFARAVEAIELLNYPGMTPQQCATLIYISQSGSSGEVVPVFNSLPAGVEKIGITNDVASPLGQHADFTLPLCAGSELTVATKTYLNSLALLGLLAGIDPQALRDVSVHIHKLLETAEQNRALWLDTLAPMDMLYFLGHGPHAITARQSAMMVGEWAKRPAMYASIGAFRHGFLEAMKPGTGIVIFAPAGVSQQSAYDLADELTSYGTTVLLVEHGYARRPHEAPKGALLQDELLAPMLDVIPVQLFVEALARETGVGTGFRYISKVIKHL